MKSTLKASGSKRSKLKYDQLLSNFAFKFELRRYSKGKMGYEDFVWFILSEEVGRQNRATSLPWDHHVIATSLPWDRHVIATSSTTDARFLSLRTCSDDDVASVIYSGPCLEDKSTPLALEYWFRCVDLDGNAALTPSELAFFYEEQLQRMECLSQEPVLFEDILCQMSDMLQPAQQGRITLRVGPGPAACWGPAVEPSTL